MRYDKNQIIFCDTETTGLYPHRGHEVWEIAYVYWDQAHEAWKEGHWFVKPRRMALADPISLGINRFYERTGAPNFKWNEPQRVAHLIAQRFAGKHIVGAIPSFDKLFLEKFLRQHKQVLTCHYHIIDVEAMCLGWMAVGASVDSRDLPLPWKSDWMLGAVGVKAIDESLKHTALGDALQVQAVWEHIIGL